MLNELFGIENSTSLRSSLVANTILRGHAPRARHYFLSHICAGLDIESLVADQSSTVRIWYPSKAGQRSAIVEARAARHLYESLPVSLLIDAPDYLHPITCAVADALSLPRSAVVASIFLNKQSVETRPHFDRVTTLSVQLAGTKRWRVGSNVQVPYPTFNWGDVSHESHDVSIYAHDIQLPGEITGEYLDEFLLREGDSLLVPHGHWHATECPEDAVSLHIHLKADHWVDVLLSALRFKLLSNACLRQRSFDIPTLLGPSARLNFAFRRAALLTAAEALVPEDLASNVTAPITAKPSYRRALASGVYVLARRADGAAIRFVRGRETEDDVTEVEVGLDVLRAVLALTGEDSWGTFTVDQLMERWSFLKPADATRAISLLIDVGYLVAVGFPAGGATPGAGQVKKSIELLATCTEGK